MKMITTSIIMILQDVSPRWARPAWHGDRHPQASCAAIDGERAQRTLSGSEKRPSVSRVEATNRTSSQEATALGQSAPSVKVRNELYFLSRGLHAGVSAC